MSPYYGKYDKEQPAGAVYALTNQTTGNAVVAFDRAADGTLSMAGTFLYRRARQRQTRAGRPAGLTRRADLKRGQPVLVSRSTR